MGDRDCQWAGLPFEEMDGGDSCTNDGHSVPQTAHLKIVEASWVWRSTPIIPALGMLRQKDCYSEVRLGWAT